MPNEWNHLPNAKHIDRILADIKQNPAAWEKVRASAFRRATSTADSDKEWANNWDTALNLSRTEVNKAARYDELKAARKATAGSMVWDAGRAAISALIAWDRAGSYLTLNPDKVKVLACLGDDIAILMYPAICILNSKEKENALPL